MSLQDEMIDEYISKMQDKFNKALKEAKEEDAGDLKEVMKGLEDSIKVIITSNDSEEKEEALKNIEIYKSILIDYKAIESLRFTNLVLDGIAVGLGIALKVAIAAI